MSCHIHIPHLITCELWRDVGVSYTTYHISAWNKKNLTIEHNISWKVFSLPSIRYVSHMFRMPSARARRICTRFTLCRPMMTMTLEKFHERFRYITQNLVRGGYNMEFCKKNAIVDPLQNRWCENACSDCYLFHAFEPNDAGHGHTHILRSCKCIRPNSTI